MYKLLFSQIVQKQQNDVPKKDLEKIKKLLTDLAENPRPRHSKKLKGGDQDYRIRYRHWRILYGIDDEKRLVVIYGILQRKEAYR